MSSLKESLSKKKPERTISVPADGDLPQVGNYPSPVVNGQFAPPPPVSASAGPGAPVPLRSSSHSMPSADIGGYPSGSQTDGKPPKSELAMKPSQAPDASVQASVFEDGRAASPDPAKQPPGYPQQTYGQPPGVFSANAPPPPQQQQQQQQQAGQPYYGSGSQQAPQQAHMAVGHPAPSGYATHTVVMHSEPQDHTALAVMIFTALCCWPCLPCACAYWVIDEQNKRERRDRLDAQAGGQRA